MAWIIENWAEVLNALSMIIAAASAVSALTPNKSDDALIAKIRKVVGLLALNVRHAKKQ